MEYYDLYIQGRVHVNAIYHYDLSVIQQAVKEGAYTDARLKLLEIIPFLEDTDQHEVLGEVETLINIAARGEEAGLLVKQSRLALQSGNFQKALDDSTQGITIYQDLGDTRRLNEAQDYQSASRQVLSLRSDIDSLEQVTDEKTFQNVASQLTTISHQLEYLGDEKGSLQAQKLLENLKTQQSRRNNFRLGTLSIFVLIILAFRFRFARTKRPDEVL